MALAATALFSVACATGDVAGDDPVGGAVASGAIGRDASTVRADAGSVAHDSGTIDAGSVRDSSTGGGSTGQDSGSVAFDAGGGGGGACVPQYSTQNQACSDCSRSQCCTSMNAFFSDSNQPAFASCLNGCGATSSCLSTCTSSYPSAGQKFQSYYGCSQLSCASACGSSSGGGGTTCTPRYNTNAPATCNTCLRTSCCDSMNAFFDEPSTLDYADCIDPLGFGLSPSMCQILFPAGAAAYAPYVSCIGSSCAVACP